MKKDVREAIENAIQDALTEPLVSNILTRKQEQQLASFVPVPSGQQSVRLELELLYRATLDGWDAKDFRSRCYDKGATITVLQTTDGAVGGGYTDKAWLPRETETTSEKAFLFALHRESGVLAKKSFGGPIQHNTVTPACFGRINGPESDEDIVDIPRWSNKQYAANLSIKDLKLQDGSTFSVDALCYHAKEVEVFRVVPSQRGRFSLEVPPTSFTKDFNPKPDVAGYVTRKCEDLLRQDHEWWDGRLPEVFCDRETAPPASSSSSGASDFLKNPPFLLEARFPGLCAEVLNQIRRAKDSRGSAAVEIRKAVQNLVERLQQDMCMGKWRKTLLPGAVQLDVVSEDRVQEFLEEVALVFLQHNASLLVSVMQRTPALVDGFSNLVEHCASARHKIEGDAKQLQQAINGITNIILSHEEAREPGEHAALLRTVGCRVIFKGGLAGLERRVPRGSVGIVQGVDQPNDPRIHFTVRGQLTTEWFKETEFKSLYVLGQ